MICRHQENANYLNVGIRWCQEKRTYSNEPQEPRCPKQRSKPSVLACIVKPPHRQSQFGYRKPAKARKTHKLYKYRCRSERSPRKHEFQNKSGNPSEQDKCPVFFPPRPPLKTGVFLRQDIGKTGAEGVSIKKVRCVRGTSAIRAEFSSIRERLVAIRTVHHFSTAKG
jgi:hypothetical protein